jgi:acetylglutamate kinase
LVYLTNFAGVKDAEGSVIRRLDVNAIVAMVEEETVSGGMVPKLEACTGALKNGVTRVLVLPATRAEVLPGFFTHPIDCGTEVIAS